MLRCANAWPSSPHDTSETGTAAYPLSCGLIAQRCKRARGARQPHLCSAESCGRLDLAFGEPPDTDLPKIPGFEYLRDIEKRLAEAHEFAKQRQEQAGSRQKRGYDLRCQGRSFMPGERVWVYNPTWKKGSPPN